MRPYIEGRFRVHAADRTTAEIMTLMGGCTDPAYSDDQADRLATLFAEADLVKFARLEPAVPAAMAALEQAVAFVEATARARELGEAGDPTGAGGATGPRGPAVTAPTESEVEP